VPCGIDIQIDHCYIPASAEQESHDNRVLPLVLWVNLAGIAQAGCNQRKSLNSKGFALLSGVGGCMLAGLR